MIRRAGGSERPGVFSNLTCRSARRSRLAKRFSFHDRHPQPPAQLRHRPQPPVVHVAGHDPAGVVHQLGQVRRLAAGGGAQVQHRHARLRGDRTRRRHRRQVLHREPALRVARQRSDRQRARPAAATAGAAPARRHARPRRTPRGASSRVVRRGLTRTHSGGRFGEPEPKPHRFVPAEPGQPAIGQPARQREAGREVFGRVASPGRATPAASAGDTCRPRAATHRRPVRSDVVIGERPAQAAEHAVDEPGRLAWPVRLRQLDRLVDGRVRRDVAQVNELIRSEAEQFPDLGGDAIARPVGVGADRGRRGCRGGGASRRRVRSPARGRPATAAFDGARRRAVPRRMRGCRAGRGGPVRGRSLGSFYR